MRQRLFDQDRPPMPILVRLTVLLLFWILLLYALIAARTFLYPLALGILFALLLLPVTSRLERWGVPRIMANLIGLVLGGGVIYGVVFFLYRQLGALLMELPDIKEQALANLRDLIGSVADRVGMKVTTEMEGTLFDNFESVVRGTGDSLGEVLNATGNTVLAIGIMPVYVFMFLYYRDKFSRFLMMLVPESAQELGRTVLLKVSLVTTRYMTGMFAVVLILSVLNSVGFLIIGLQYAILMGVIAAICNIIPYFGTIIGYSIPFGFAFLTGTGFDLAFAVLIQFFIIQFSENNIITPNILGGMLRINPFFIILGVLAGGMVWGLPGMFIIVPVLAMLKVICDHVPSLKPYSFLMSDRGTEKHSITARKVRRFFAFSPVAKKEVEGMLNDGRSNGRDPAP
jgi:predicted PurR-regulated permease PerM